MAELKGTVKSQGETIETLRKRSHDYQQHKLDYAHMKGRLYGALAIISLLIPILTAGLLKLLHIA